MDSPVTDAPAAPLSAADRAATALTPAIQTRGLDHFFGEGEARKQALFNIDLEIARGEFVMLMGASGSGKTTLLTLVGCLRQVRDGEAWLLGQPLAQAPEAALAAYRRRVGFIFQAQNLHGSLTAMQNVRLGLEIHGRTAMRGWKEAAAHALTLLGLEDRLHYLPANLSGGQKQRVAIARALVGNPEVVFADEPTAALDKESGFQVARLLRDLGRRRGVTTLMVTHDPRILEMADRIIRMEDGRIVDDGR